MNKSFDYQKTKQFFKEHLIRSFQESGDKIRQECIAIAKARTSPGDMVRRNDIRVAFLKMLNACMKESQQHMNAPIHVRSAAKAGFSEAIEVYVEATVSDFAEIGIEVIDP